jgi:hypothetical protein
MRIDLIDVLAPIIVPLFTALVGWGVMRRIQAGGPLSSYQKGLLFYGFIFVVGAGYSMMLVFRLDLPKPLWLLLTVMWAAIIGKIAQKHYQRERDPSPESTDVEGDNKDDQV